MKHLIACIAVTITLIVSLVLWPLFMTDSMPPVNVDSLMLWLVTVVLLFIMIGSLISLYFTFLHYSYLKAALNLIFSIVIISFLLPMYFCFLNLAIFNSITFSKTVFGPYSVISGPLTTDSVCIDSKNSFSFIPYKHIDEDNIVLLCPIGKTVKSLLYQTVKVKNLNSVL